MKTQKIKYIQSLTWFFVVLLPVAFLFSNSSGNQDQVLAITNAQIYPVTQTPIQSGTLLVKGSKILAVGKNLTIPHGAKVIDAKGQFIMPGIVESHSHMGQKQLWQGPVTHSNNNELSNPINAHCLAIDGLNTDDMAFPMALEAGVTTMNIIPGSRSPNSGQAVVVKLRGGTAEEMFYAHGGMKFAIRATERRPNFPKSNQEVGDLLRSKLKEAREYSTLSERHGSDDFGGSEPGRNLILEALSKVVTREWFVGVHATNAKDMGIAMDLQKEFNLDLYIIHGYGVTTHAEELAKLGISISYGPVFPFMGREHESLDGAVRFMKQGGKLSIHQDHPDGHQYYLRHAAALFVRRGVQEDEALKALTINPAELLRIDDRVGSLEPGKDADFLILNGPPIEMESLVERVFIEGKEVFNRNTRRTVFDSKSEID
ncbi:amidohydrolase family protein [Acidobacteriota bacterium]